MGEGEGPNPEPALPCLSQSFPLQPAHQDTAKYALCQDGGWAWGLVAARGPEALCLPFRKLKLLWRGTVSLAGLSGEVGEEVVRICSSWGPRPAQ